MAKKERQPGRKEMDALAEDLAGTFLMRRDLYAKQLGDGSYVSIRKPLHQRHLMAHLKGEMTLGAYVLDEESRGRYLVLDADDAPDWRRLQALAGVLPDLGGASYLEASRRGGHLWLFFDEPLPGREIRRFGHGLLGHFGIEEVEIFPKQDELTTGPGSLVRLPFGVHQKSGRRYGFYLSDGNPLGELVREQIRSLRAPETLSKSVLEQFMAYEPTQTRNTPYKRPRRVAGDAETVGADATLSERIKAGIPLRQFVLRYVELSPSGRGLCPFHDDHNPSFAVNDEKGYWKCFAGCGGGSVIDFHMRYQEQVLGRECDFKTAVTELAEAHSI